MSTPPPDEPVPQSADGDPTVELVAYLDGELDERRAQAVEARLGRDPAVRREAEALRKTWDLLDYLPTPPGPATDFTSRTLERLDKVEAPAPTVAGRPPRLRAGLRTALRWLAVAALLAAAAAGGYFGRAWLTAPKGPPAAPPEQDPQVLADLRVIDNLRLYVHVDDIDYLQLLDHPDRFGPEAPEH